MDPTSHDKLIPFRPFIDQDSLLRSHGRLVYAPLAPAIRNPLLLDSKEPITKLYLKHAHEICCHAGPEFVKTFVEQRFKVLGIRAALRSINYRCFVSVLKTSNQKWLRYHNYALPVRIHRSRSKKLALTPFFIVNDCTTEKHYGIIFNCLVSCACHLESCSSMTTDSFLNAFRRFIARLARTPASAAFR